MIRDQRPIRTARRGARQRERQRLGIAASPCLLCIEEHHVAGRNHDPLLTAPLCQKHHREMHELLLRSGISLSYEPNPTKRVALALRATAIYMRAQAEAMERWASLLEGQQLGGIDNEK